MDIRKQSEQYASILMANVVPPPTLKNGAGGVLHSGLSICEWVHEFVHPENLVNTISSPNDLYWVEWDVKPYSTQPYLKNQLRKFCPIVVTDIFGFIRVLISFLGHRSRSHSRHWR